MTTQTATRPSPAVLDVSDRTFEREVLARSREVPVVVDFWAPWCGPCRVLGPTLERLAQQANGGFVLAKVNVDENPQLAQAFRVQGIPAVKAFRDGRVVDEFTGALPEGQVRAWLKGIAPSEADQLVAAAQSIEASDPEGAIARYRLVLGSDPGNAAALFSLGRLQLLRGDPEGAALLNEVPAGTPFFGRAQAMLGLGEMLAAAQEAPAAELRARVERSGADLEARFALAGHAARSSDYAAALDELLEIVMRDRGYRNDGARKAMLALFAVLGDESALAGEYRRRLSNALF